MFSHLGLEGNALFGCAARLLKFREEEHFVGSVHLRFIQPQPPSHFQKPLHSAFLALEATPHLGHLPLARARRQKFNSSVTQKTAATGRAIKGTHILEEEKRSRAQAHTIH